MDNHDSRLPWFTRRAVLGTAAGAALGAYGLSLGLAAEVPDVFDGTQFKIRAPESNAKRGGVLRYGVLSAPAHFDVHQSGTVSNIGTQGCMYDNLIRRDPRDSGQSIIPDLAHSWEIAKDGKTYTFFLRIKDVSPSLLGGFLYPFSEYATPTAKLVERPGYQRDPKAAVQEARQLMAAAGYPQGLKLDFLVRDAPNLKLWAVASQAMLKETLNIEANMRMVQISVWFDEAQAGTFDLTISATVSTLLDPSDYFNAWYAKGAPQNYSRWSNNEFQDLLPQIARELDETRRKALIRQAEHVLEQDPPLLPVSWEKVNDAWHNYVKGHNPYNYFGLYDVVRFDTFWLDK